MARMLFWNRKMREMENYLRPLIPESLENGGMDPASNVCFNLFFSHMKYLIWLIPILERHGYVALECCSRKPSYSS